MRIPITVISVVLGGAAWACAGSGSPASLTQSPAECHYAAPDGERIYAEIEVDDPAILVEQPSPLPYPSEMRRRGIAGRVSVHYVIDDTGAVVASSIYVDSASHPEFESAARELLASSRFKPAVRNQQPVRVCVKQNLNYELS